MLALAAGFLFASCDKNGDPAGDTKLKVVNIKDLHSGVASTSPRASDSVYFSLEKGEKVAESSTDWDIKFSASDRSADITFGNGATGQLVEGTFNAYETAPENGYLESITGIGNVYTYTANKNPKHALLITPDRLIIVKTGKEKYAKIEMISYYKGNPDTKTPEFAALETRPADKHYTFKYVLQADGTNKF